MGGGLILIDTYFMAKGGEDKKGGGERQLFSKLKNGVYDFFYFKIITNQNQSLDKWDFLLFVQNAHIKAHKPVFINVDYLYLEKSNKRGD